MITPDEIDFETYMHVTDHQQKVRKASTYVQALLDRMASKHQEKRVYLPWGKTHRLIQFRPGEVTLWGGENGSGKSLVTGQVALSLCAQDEKVCIASFEMKPTKTMERMGRQWTKLPLIDSLTITDDRHRAKVVDLYEQFAGWTDDKLWLYDQQGTVEWKQVCAVARYCAKELGITQFFLDNLAKTVAGEDDFNGQKACMDELCSIARDNNIHIHVVHHVKKPAAGNHKPTKYDVKGSGSITDQADNVILTWRNKDKERLRDAKKVFDEKDHDALLIVDKQRNGEWEGYIGLHYHPVSQQFVAKHYSDPMDFYAPPEAEVEAEC